MAYEAVIGIEVHAELATETKLFCGCRTQFGAPPNSQTCPVCLGLPGVLPVLNRRAFEYALKIALALECHVDARTSFDRKNYYYPVFWPSCRLQSEEDQTSGGPAPFRQHRRNIARGCME